MHLRTYVFVCVCKYVCMYVRMYVCMYVRMAHVSVSSDSVIDHKAESARK